MDRPRQIVALVSDAIFPYHRGGKEIRYHEIARRLSRQAEVHVYTMNWWRGPRTRRDGDVTYHAISPLVPLYAGERRSILQAIVFALSCFRLLFARFDAIEADHMPYVQLFPLWLVAKIKRKLFAVTWHEYWGPDYWREYIGRVGLVGWWFERFSMRLPDAIIAASPQTAERVRPWVRPNVEVTVAPNGVDLEEISRIAAAPQTSDLVLVGRLNEHKHADRLVETVALLREAGIEASCRLIGDGPERDALREQAATLGVSDLIEFRHDVAGQEELYSLLKAARAFVFPSVREGFGIAVLEALACGLPVVTTAAEDNMARHLVARSERGVVCAPDPASIAEAVEHVLGSNGDRTHATEAWVRDYDWDHVTDVVATVVLR